MPLHPPTDLLFDPCADGVWVVVGDTEVRIPRHYTVDEVCAMVRQAYAELADVETAEVAA